MNDKDNFDTDSEDEFYDDALDENFELGEDDFDSEVDPDALTQDTDYDDYDDYEEEWEEEALQDVSGIKEKSKFSLNFNTIVILGAVVLGGVIMMSQISKEKEGQAITEVATSSVVPTALKMEGAFDGPGAIKKRRPSLNQEEVQIDKSSQEDGGFLFDVDILDQKKDIINDTPPMPSPIVSEEDNVINDSMDIFSEDSEFIDSDRAALSEITHNESVTDQEKNITILPSINSNEVKLTTTVEDNIVAEVTAPVSNIEERDVDLLKNDVPSLSVKEEGSEKKISASDSVGTRLDNIVSRLEAMDSKITALEVTSNERVDKIVSDIEALKKQKVTTSSSLPKPAKVSKKSSSKKIVPPSPPKAAVKVLWELRAAQPGKAWVSKKGQAGMQPVVVGDQLSGIGRIHSIAYVDGKWIVQGSSGRISQ